MAANTRKEAAKRFAAYWSERRGSEKGEDQTFWNSLLSEVLGVSDVKSRIHYQEPVHYKGTTKFLDAWIPETQVLIEHKSRGVDLDAPQAHHDGQTPFQQAWDYDNNRPRREKARWIVVTNFDEIRIHDMEVDVPETTFETILLKDLAKEVHRLDFLVKEVESIREKEARVSIEAGRVVGKLYNAFLEQVGEGAKDPKILRDLNILCVRLVFCVYAEDAGVFEKDAFLNFLRQFKPASFHLQLKELFKVLAQRPEERGGFLAPELKAFPYVGGGLFRDETDIPVFSDKVAHILLDEASEHFDWSEISPTIFGAVFESTLNPETRRKGGMHYTSEENIHKVIDPLFLNDLRDGFAAIKEKPAGKARDRELEAFQKKLGGLTFLDPACGSGNFLTETYISLRKLENEALALRFRGQGQFDLEDRKLVHVSINQFFGLEINDFAVTVAQTAMWIAECKMMEDTNRILSKNFTPLPLTDSAKIVEGNALRMDWPKADYIMGNPPFIGARNKSSEQAADVESVFPGWKNVGNLDYVTCWYKKANDIMKGTATRVAFVSTNSICQGDGVAILWKPLFAEGLEIDFAWRTFVWDSEALDKAHVHVVIIGFHCENLGAARIRALKPIDATHAVAIADKKALKDAFGRFGEVANIDDGYVVRFSKETAGKILRHKGFDQSCIAGLFDEIFRHSLWAWDDDVRFEEGKKAHRNFRRYRNYIGKVRVGKSNYYVRFTITETIGNGNLVHSTFVSDVRVYDEGAGGLSIPDSNRAKGASAPLTDNRIAEWFGTVKGGKTDKWLFDVERGRTAAKHINGYLADAADVFVESRSKPMENVPKICIGSQPIDDGNFLFTAEEKKSFIEREPKAERFIHPWLGSQEFINGIERYCLWLGDCPPNELRSMPACMERVKAVRDFRLASKRTSTLRSADHPTHFAAETIPGSEFIILPKVSSERREYVPMGFMTPDVFCSDLVFLIPNATLYHFGVLTSSVHMAWMRTVCGRLKSDYRYSAAIVYNNFPWLKTARPYPPSEASSEGGAMRGESAPYRSGVGDGRANTPGSPQSEIEKTAQGILDARAKYPDSSLADLYDPLTMPPELRKAHAANDAAVMKAYGFPSNLTEPEIVSRLFEMYAKLTKGV